MPDEANRIYLGGFPTHVPAVKEARRYYPQSNGWYYCARACHTG
jgi:hypothetical protein